MKEKASGCFKYGCIGCLSILALLVGLMLLAGAVQLASDHDPTPEQREASHELPPAPFPNAPIYDEGEVPLDPESPPVSVSLTPEAPEGPSGRVVLDIAMADLTIRPGPADQPIRLESDFDTSAFELNEELSSDDDGNWTYTVSFGARGGFLGLLLKGGGDAGRLELIVPRGRPIEIVGEIGMGKSETDLGGLWVTQVDLELGMGDHFLEVREPMPFPMQSFRVESSAGNFEVHSLGEASPARIEVNHRMGELYLDLEGTWRNDADVDVAFGMGACRMWLPKGARVDIDQARVSMGERSLDLPDQDNLPEDAPTLTLHLEGSMGELRIDS